jgi:hypothetical protein
LAAGELESSTEPGRIISKVKALLNFYGWHSLGKLDEMNQKEA